MTDIKNNGLWDWEGRIARLPYFLIVLATAVCGGILSVPLEHGASAWLLVLLVPIFYISVLAAIKRSHDVGLSGWYWWLSLVPLANLIFGLYLLFKAGDAGVNRYGPSPIDRSTADATPPPTNSAKATHVAVEPRRPTSIEPETHSESATSPMTKSPMPAQETLTIDEDAIYDAIAKELDTGTTDKGLWTRLFAECDGDENKTKVAYIKQRAERIRTLEQGRIAAIEKQREEAAAEIKKQRDETAAKFEQLRQQIAVARRKRLATIDVTDQQMENIASLGSTHTAAMFRDYVCTNDMAKTQELLKEMPLLTLHWEEAYGDTPLHLAVKHRLLQMTRLLIEHGAQIGQTNMDGDTPMDIAKKTGNREIVELLSAAE